MSVSAAGIEDIYGLLALNQEVKVLHRHLTSKITSLRKHAHAIYRNSLGCKNENFDLKIFDIFLSFAQEIDCGYMLEPTCRGYSVYPQPMFWKNNNKNRYVT